MPVEMIMKKGGIKMKGGMKSTKTPPPKAASSADNKLMKAGMKKGKKY